MSLNRRLKIGYTQMFAFLRSIVPLLVLLFTFALCCAVEAVPNDGEEKNSGNSNGGNHFHEQYHSSFEAHINK